MNEIPNLEKLTAMEREAVADELTRRAKDHEKRSEEVHEEIADLMQLFDFNCDKAYHLRRLAHVVRTYNPSPKRG